MKDYVEKTLGARLMGDGGWVEFVEEKDGVVTCVFRGECSKCHILDRCTVWMEEKIFRDLGVHVKIRAVRRKPYFWDVK